MNKQKIKNKIIDRRKGRVRSRVFGTAKRPRLSVFRSLKHITVQLIDDNNGHTLVSVKDSEVKGQNKTEKAAALGKLLAQKAKAAKIKSVVFDKGAYKFHGRVKAMADAAKEDGLQI